MSGMGDFAWSIVFPPSDIHWHFSSYERCKAYLARFYSKSQCCYEIYYDEIFFIEKGVSNE